MIKRLVITLILLALLFGGIYAWKARQGAMQGGGPGGAATVVSTQSVTRENWQPVLRAVGTVTPTRGVIVSAEVAGVIRDIQFDSGQRVEQGDLLLQLDDEVDQAELAALEADLKLAEITRDRLQRVVSGNLGSRSDLDEAEATLDSTEARVEAKRALIRKKTIRAPFSGELGIRRVNPGQYLAPGGEVARLVALDPIFVEYQLPERHLSSLSVDQAVNIRVQAAPGRVFSGRLYAISPSIETASRSVTIRALFDNPERILLPGMFAEVDTLLPEQEAVMTLPERAVTFNPYGDAVFVVNDGDPRTVKRVQIKTGGVTNGRIEILSGLEDGAEVVTDGHNKLRNGQPVQIDNSNTPDAPQ